MKPERALRLLDNLDAAAYAVWFACAGYWGARLRCACLTAGFAATVLLARLPLA